MMERADEILRRYAAGKKLAVGVSGGADSMCLLHFLLTRDYIDKERLTAVHVNHHLRQSAERDAAFVARFCAENNVRFERVDADVPSRCVVTGRSVESEAREVRLEVFIGLMTRGAAELVLTAHHASDQAETVLMHLFRGCGTDGLCGMEILSPIGLLRPLLTTEKSEIDAYVSQHSIPYVTDETNADIRYSRNFVRHEILPLIESRWSGAARNISRTAALVRADCDVLEGLIDETLIAAGEGEVTVPLSAMEGATGARYVRRALQKLGVASDLTEKNVLAATGLRDLKNGARVDLGGGVTAAREYDRVAFYRLGAASDFGQRKADSSAGRTDTETAETPFAVGDMELGGEVICALPLSVRPQKGICAFDLDRIPAGAVLRYRRDGDVFRPFGGGRKKLKEYLIDRKIPVRFRDKLPCLCYNKTILAVVGVEVSEDIKLTEQTTRPYRIFLREKRHEGT